MPDYYVSLVKEYLELNGFIVKAETKYLINEKDSKGFFRKSWGDIDIIATKVKPDNTMEIRVGEVKAEGQNEKGIREISTYKFENPHVKKKIAELFGSNTYDKFLYCWNCKTENIQVAKSLGITVVPFSTIVNYMIETIQKKQGWFYEKDFPNLMLIQYLKDKNYLNKSPSK
jgi:Holliday junction resolvase-like predicted endonuclease